MRCHSEPIVPPNVLWLNNDRVVAELLEQSVVQAKVVRGDHALLCEAARLDILDVAGGSVSQPGSRRSVIVES